jgi:outer membrane protein TolC
MQAELEIEAGEQTKQEAFTKYFPKVSATVGGFIAKDPLVNLAVPGGNLPVYDGNPATLPKATQFAYSPGMSLPLMDRGYVAEVQAVQPVYAGGRIINGVRLAEVGLDVAREKREMALRDVTVEIERLYWQHVALYEKLSTIKAYEGLLGRLDIQATQALQTGVATPNELLKVRLKQSEATVDRRRVEEGIRVSAHNLRRYLGLPPGDDVRLASELPIPSDPARLSSERDGAVSRRAEMRILEKSAESEELRVRIKRGELFPSLSVGAIAYHMDVHDMGTMNDAVGFAVLDIPISEIWGGSHAMKEQQRRYAVAMLHASKTSEVLEVEMQQKWSDLDVAWLAAKVSDEAVAQAEVNVSEITHQFEQGSRLFSDVLEAQVLRQQAVERRVDALVEFWVKRGEYLRTVRRDPDKG